MASLPTQVERIEITGFRSLKEIAWEPGRLNVIIGRNGSGKSNLLWALELLQESARGKLRERVLAEGGIRQLLWDNRAPGIGWKVKLRLASPRESRSLTYELQVRPKGVEGGHYVAHELLADYRRVESGEKLEPFKYLERNPGHTVIWDSEKQKLVPLTKLEPSSEQENEQASSLPEDETVLSELIPYGDIWTLLFARGLLRFRIAHDLETGRRAAVREAAVSRVERTLVPDGQNLIPVLHTLYTGNREFKRSIDSAMRTAFENDFEELVFAPAADQKVQMRVRWKSLTEPISAANLSDGTLRFLMLLTALANPDLGSLVAIDEPETGLHPRMFPIIAEFAASASERTSVILTTHSPQLLDAFPSDCVPTITVAECVEGETKLSILPPDELKRWLTEYGFGSAFKSGALETLA